MMLHGGETLTLATPHTIGDVVRQIEQVEGFACSITDYPCHNNQAHETWLYFKSQYVGVFRHHATAAPAGDDLRRGITFDDFQVELTAHLTCQETIKRVFQTLGLASAFAPLALIAIPNGVEEYVFAFPMGPTADAFMDALDERELVHRIHVITGLDTVEDAVAFVDDHIH